MLYHVANEPGFIRETTAAHKIERNRVKEGGLRITTAESTKAGLIYTGHAFH